MPPGKSPSLPHFHLKYLAAVPIPPRPWSLQWLLSTIKRTGSTETHHGRRCPHGHLQLHLAGQALIATSSSAANWSSVGGTSSIPLQRLATWTMLSTASQSNWLTLGDYHNGTSCTAGGTRGFAFLGVTPANTTPSGWLGLKFYTFGANTLFQSLAGLNRSTNVRCWIGLTSATGATIGGSAAPQPLLMLVSATIPQLAMLHGNAAPQTPRLIPGIERRVCEYIGKSEFCHPARRGQSDIQFLYHGALVASIATHLPASSTAMAGILNITTLVTPFTAQLVTSRVTVQSDS